MSKIIALVRDLIFASRITATARAQGVEVGLLRDPAALGAEGGGRLLVDLNQPAALEAAAAWKAIEPAEREVIGFVSHVDADTIAAARAAGIDQVLARSAFVEKLPALLSGRGVEGGGGASLH